GRARLHPSRRAFAAARAALAARARTSIHLLRNGVLPRRNAQRWHQGALRAALVPGYPAVVGSRNCITESTWRARRARRSTAAAAGAPAARGTAPAARAKVRRRDAAQAT